MPRWAATRVRADRKMWPRTVAACAALHREPMRIQLCVSIGVMGGPGEYGMEHMGRSGTFRCLSMLPKANNMLGLLS